MKRITVGYAQYHNVKFALGFFKDIGQFEIFMKQSNEDKCLENNPPKRYTDEDLEELISSFVAINNLCTMDIDLKIKSSWGGKAIGVRTKFPGV